MPKERIDYSLKQDIARFKRLKRRLKHESNMSILDELIKLDESIASRNPKWRRMFNAIPKS